MKRSRAGIAGALLALAGLGWWWVAVRTSYPEIRPLVSPGQECAFDLSWQAHSTSRFGGGAAARAADLGVDLDLRGTLRIESAEDGERSEWSVRFEPRGESLLRVGGKTLLSGTAIETAAAAATSVLRVGPDGSVIELAVADDDSKVLEMIARLLQTRLNPVWGTARAHSWTRSERNEVGDGEVRYLFRGRRDLERERASYRELALRKLIADAAATVKRANTSWRWDGESGVARVQDEETTVLHNAANEEVGSVETKATLERLGCVPRSHAAERPPQSRWVRLDVTQPLVSGGSSQESALDRRIAGLTLDAMIAGLEHLALVPRDPEKAEFLVRATGLLIQHPEYSDALVPIATRAGLSLEGRMVVLDVLASVGHDSAQAAMRDALEHPAMRANRDEFNALVQRFSFVSVPTEESLGWLQREWERGGAGIGTAGALGSVAGRFTARGNEALAKAAVTSLTRSLERTDDPKTRSDLIRALGNVRSPSVARTVLKEARAKAPELRAAAAFALRGIDLPEARDTLVELARDPLPSVALSAYAALESQQLTKSQLEALLEDVISGRVPASAEATVVTYLTKHIDESPFVLEALKAIAGRTESPDVKARAASALRVDSAR
jgi:hypothetical protein